MGAKTCMDDRKPGHAGDAGSADEAGTLSGAIAACRARIPGFVQRHFRYPGAWHSNRHAMGWDLARAPANLLWAPFYVTAMLLSQRAARAGRHRLAAVLERTPAGFTTRVQRHLNHCIRADLLAPLAVATTGANADPTQLLDRYASTRTAAADIGNTVASAAFGALALKQFTPGGIAIGLLLAGWLARRQQAESFFLGATAGEWYATLFPAAPGALTQIAAVIAVLCCLAVFASLSGLLTDPLQARLGLHRWRLERMLDHLERDLDSAGSSYRPRDPFIARVLELFDLLRSPFG